MVPPRWPKWLRRPPRERKIRGSNPASDGDLSGHTSDLNIGTPVATSPGAWRYRVSARTGRPGVSILWLGEVDSLICNRIATGVPNFLNNWYDSTTKNPNPRSSALEEDALTTRPTRRSQIWSGRRRRVRSYGSVFCLFVCLFFTPWS